MPARGGMRKLNTRPLRSAGHQKNVPLNQRLGVKKTVKSPANPGKGDARLKIIQKKRKKLIDARDKLAQIAKTKDAREKLIKLRENRVNGKKTLNESVVRPVGSSIMMKTDRNGKISLSTNKSRMAAAAPQVSLGLAVQRELGLVPPRQKISAGPTSRQVHRKLPVTIQRQVARAVPRSNLPTRNMVYAAPSPGIDGYGRDSSMTEDYVAPPPVIRRTIHNDFVRELPPLPDFSSSNDPGIYTWTRNSLSDVRRKKTMKIITRNDLVEDEWRASVRPMTRVPAHYIDLDAVDDMPMYRPTQSTGVHARLDTPPSAIQSHGIFSQNKNKSIVSPGHRIVVSNLHPAVTQEDITELFADIGDLMVARLVRPGTAEVVYKNLMDAEKAVEVYHNRQLDGQPMKCLLVNKRPANNPTAPAIIKPSSSGIRTTMGGVVKKPSSTSKMNKLIPDIDTIHKVLFNRT